MQRRTATRKSRRKARAATSRFRDIIEAHQRNVEAGLRSEDRDERHRALQRRLNGYDLEHLQRFFGRRAVADVQTASIREYAMRRQEQGAAIRTVNEELRTLWQLTRYACRSGIDWRPSIEFLRDPAEEAARDAAFLQAARKSSEDFARLVAGKLFSDQQAGHGRVRPEGVAPLTKDMINSALADPESLKQKLPHGRKATQEDVAKLLAKELGTRIYSRSHLFRQYPQLRALLS